MHENRSMHRSLKENPMKTADLPDTTRPIRPPARNVNAPQRPEPPTLDDATFTRGPARRPAPAIADPLLQWASGLPTADRRIYAGWLIEYGKHEDLDTAMPAAGFSLVTIKHGSGNLVTHWAVETATVFVVADGVQSIGEMKRTRIGLESRLAGGCYRVAGSSRSCAAACFCGSCWRWV
jgi:hypothetical protein